MEDPIFMQVVHTLHNGLENVTDIFVVQANALCVD